MSVSLADSPSALCPASVRPYIPFHDPEVAISGAAAGVATYLTVASFNNLMGHRAPLANFNSLSFVDRMVYVGAVKNTARISRNFVQKRAPSALGHWPSSLAGGFFGDGLAQATSFLFLAAMGREQQPFLKGAAPIATSGMGKFVGNYYARRFIAKRRGYAGVGQLTSAEAGLSGLSAGLLCGAIRAGFVMHRTGDKRAAGLTIARTSLAIGANYWAFDVTWKFLTKRREEKTK